MHSAIGLWSFLSAHAAPGELVLERAPGLPSCAPLGAAVEALVGPDRLEGRRVFVDAGHAGGGQMTPFLSMLPLIGALSRRSTCRRGDPILRLEASADAAGWGTAHDNQKNNGQDH